MHGFEITANLPLVDAEHAYRALIGIFVFSIGTFVCKLLYNACLHPLSRYPGPWLRATSPLPFVLDVFSGRQTDRVRNLHAKYGNVVRISPDQLSFASMEARQDIYGLRVGHKNLPKDPQLYHVPPQGAHSIISSPNNAHHARFRRALNHAFSEKAMREQESLIKHYVDGFISQLQSRASQGPQNMTAWFNFTTFDIIGDLSFGESFGCIEHGRYHPWISNLFGNVKAGSYLLALKSFPLLLSIVRPVLKSLPSFKKRQIHSNLSVEKVNARLAIETERPDFMTYILRHRGKETELSLPEMQATAAGLVIAGSETTATLLTATTYHLLKHPEVLKKLTTEIRSSYASEDDINMISSSKLRYQAAVLEESLRIQPPAPLGLLRVVPPGGDTIDGNWLPEGTRVSTPIFTVSRHPEYFEDADSFIPERWLGEEGYGNDNLAASKPFSIGPRDCIGKNLAYAEMRMILSRLLWNFDLEPTEDSNKWADELRTYLIWDKGPLMVNLQPVRAA